jgi:hypothetical protein
VSAQIAIGNARGSRALFRPLAERLPKFCKFAVGYFDDVQVCNVEVSAGGRKQHAGRPHTGGRAVRSPELGLHLVLLRSLCPLWCKQSPDSVGLIQPLVQIKRASGIYGSIEHD